MRQSDPPNRARPARPRVAGLYSGVLALCWMLAAAPAIAAPPVPPSDAQEPDVSTSEPEPAEDVPPIEPEPASDTPSEPPAEDATPTGVDPAALERIDAESRALQDDLFKARARVAVVTSKLFRAKITLQLRSNLERFYEVSDLVIALDGAPVFLQDKGWPTAAGDLFEVYAAPGAHELTISARLVARRDATYKLRIDDTFTVLVPEDSTVFTRLMLRETGNMWRFTKRGRGRHVLTAILRARAKPNVRRGARAKAAGGQK